MPCAIPRDEGGVRRGEDISPCTAWLPVVGQYLNTIKNTSLTMTMTMTIGLAGGGRARRRALEPDRSRPPVNVAVIADNLGYLLAGAWPDGPVGGLMLTLILSAASGLASAVLGLVLGIALAMSGGWTRRGLTLGLGLLRAVPIVMLIFWSYFLLPILFGFSIPETGTVVTALSLVGGAYLSYAVAAGIESIGRGQWKAGLALGLGRWQVLRVVVLPQALPAMAPSFVNQWTALIKDTSLAYVIGVPELSFVATQVNNRAIVYPAEIFLFVGAVYGGLCLLVDRLATRLAGRGGGKRRAAA